MGLTRLAIRRPLAILVLFAVIALFGAVGYLRLGLDLMPRLNVPVVTVAVPVPGAGPTDVETKVTRPIEDAVVGASGVKSVSSVSAENLATVIVEFQDHVDADEATAEVERRVQAVRATLPPEAEAPNIIKTDVFALPMMELAMTGRSRDPAELHRLADKVVRPRLEAIDGVATVSLIGGREREVQVQVQPDRLRAYAVPIQEVEQALRTDNLSLPAGTLREGRREETLRYDALVAAPEQLGGIVVRKAPEGGIVYLRDVATVRDTIKTPRQLYRFNGQEGVGIVITKRSDANTVAVARAVRSALADLQPALGPDVRLDVVSDSSAFIYASLQDIQRELGLAVVLTGLVLLLFLHTWRSTAIVLLAIPTSLVGTLGVMWVLGFSINIVSLLALTMTIGILVDDSIVVLENIHRHLSRGEAPEEAALNGRSEIGLAAIAITLLDVVIFVPVAFTSGLVGSIFREFGLTVATATLFSLLVSFTLTPLLASRWLRHQPADRGFRARLIAWWERGYGALERLYAWVLERTLQTRPLVLGLAALSLAGAVGLVGLGLVGSELIPQVDQNELTVQVELPPGSSLEATAATLAQVEERLRALPDVQTTASSAGVATSVAHALLEQSQGQARFGSIKVRLVDKRERQHGLEEVLADVRRLERGLPPGVKLRTQVPIVGIPVAQPFSARLQGPDLTTLTQLASQVETIVAETPGVTDVTNTAAAGARELRVRPDRARAADLGIPPAQVARALRLSYEGEVVSTFRPPDGDPVDVRLVASPEIRGQWASVADLPLLTPSGALVSLRQVASIEEVSSQADIRRVDRQRQVTVSANLAGRDLGAVSADVQVRLRGLPLPSGYSVRLVGQTEEMGASFAALFGALAVSILLMYLLLVVLYDSVLLPFVTMFSVPLAAVGAVAALALAGQSLNILSLIGAIMLVGLAGKNGILLVDYTNTLRKAGLPRDIALRRAAPTRLRPILMTSLAVMLAMLPVALGLGAGAELRQPMAIAAIGGVVSSTLLTLFVVPVAYSLVEDWGDRVLRERASVGRAAAALMGTVDDTTVKMPAGGAAPDPDAHRS